MDVYFTGLVMCLILKLVDIIFFTANHIDGYIMRKWHDRYEVKIRLPHTCNSRIMTSFNYEAKHSGSVFTAWLVILNDVYCLLRAFHLHLNNDLINFINYSLSIFKRKKMPYSYWLLWALHIKPYSLTWHLNMRFIITIPRTDELLGRFHKVCQGGGWKTVSKPWDCEKNTLKCCQISKTHQTHCEVALDYYVH